MTAVDPTRRALELPRSDSESQTSTGRRRVGIPVPPTEMGLVFCAMRPHLGPAASGQTDADGSFADTADAVDAVLASAGSSARTADPDAPVSARSGPIGKVIRACRLSRHSVTLQIDSLLAEAGELGRQYTDGIASFVAAHPYDREAVLLELDATIAARRRLRHRGYFLLPVRELRRIRKAVRRSTPTKIHAIQRAVERLVAARRAAIEHAPISQDEARAMIVTSDDAWARLHTLAGGGLGRLARGRMRRVMLAGLDRLAAAVARMTCPIGHRFTGMADRIEASRGRKTYGSRCLRIGSWTFSELLSYESMRRTGIETSWGFRTYLPGTLGIGNNIGPWVMFYSGSLHDYQARAVPMRINPGATMALPFGVVTLNRPGFGAGASLPFASTYIDGDRYKLLFGFDGVGYVRTGDWEGRGPYVTISGSIPMLLLPISITWNFSVFSPAIEPLVRKSTPVARKIRYWTDRMVTTLLAPVRFVRFLAAGAVELIRGGRRRG